MLSPSALQNYNDSRGLEDTSVVCHAPFNSMYFMPEGQIVPCCYNRSHLYGKYPHVSVEDAWFGAEAVVFRNKMLERQFDVGCLRCLDQINAGNYTGVHAKIYDRPLKQGVAESRSGMSQANVYPEILEFELHNLCNLECVMCGGMHSHLIRQNREGLPPLRSPYDKEFVGQLVPFVKAAHIARFLGGEPFLIPVYFDIWEYFIEHNPKAEIHITTNATVLNNRVWRVLDFCNVHPVISVDSLDPENYESIRVNASFQKFWDNLQQLKAYCEKKGKQLTFSCCPIQQNWKHLPQVLEYSCAERIQLYFNTVVMPETASLRFLDVNELTEVIQFLEKELQRISDVNTEIEAGWMSFWPWSKPEATPKNKVVELNFNNFQGFLQQLRSWHETKMEENKEIRVTETDPWVTHLLNIQGIHVERQSLEHRLHVFDRLKVNLDSRQLLILCHELFGRDEQTPDGNNSAEWVRWVFLRDWKIRGIDGQEQSRLLATLNRKLSEDPDETGITEIFRTPMKTIVSELNGRNQK